MLKTEYKKTKVSSLPYIIVLVDVNDNVVVVFESGIIDLELDRVEYVIDGCRALSEVLRPSLLGEHHATCTCIIG